MGYTFEWDPAKAAANVRKHGVTFDEASTVFGDPLNLLMSDPDHSFGEERYLLLGVSNSAEAPGGGICRANTPDPSHFCETGHTTRKEAI